MLNAANEVAVAAFVEGRLGFTGIAELVAATLATGLRWVLPAHMLVLRNLTILVVFGSLYRAGAVAAGPAAALTAARASAAEASPRPSVPATSPLANETRPVTPDAPKLTVGRTGSPSSRRGTSAPHQRSSSPTPGARGSVRPTRCWRCAARWPPGPTSSTPTSG